MKKLYRKGTVHPSPPLVSDHLSFLPAAILTLAAALSQEDKQVLAYLISCSSGDFSGNRRNTHKSTTTNNPPPQTSTFSGAGAAVYGGVCGEKVLSGNFSGNRRNTQNKSATPISDSGNSGGGCSKGVAAVNGGVGGGVGGGGAEQLLSGDFSGNWRNTHHKSAKPNSDSGNSGGGCSKGVASVKGGVGSGGGGEKVLSGDFSGNRRNTHFKSATPNSVSENSGGVCSKGVAAVNGGVGGGADHVANFNCYCFSCYMSYWVKWDSSPNRQLIHEILDVYEDGLHSKKSNKKERRNRNGSSLKQNGSTNGDVGSSSELKKSSSELSLNKNGSGSESGSGQSDPVEETSGSYGGGGDGGDEEETGGGEKGSVRKFVSFLGEKIWGVWT